MKRRVVITGMGTVNALGLSVDETWQSIKVGRNGIGPITLFDASKQKPYLVGEVKGFDPENYFSLKEAKRLDRVMAFGIVAAQQAFDQSGLANCEFDRSRFGVYVTSGIGGLWTINEESKKAHFQSADRISPFFVTNSIINMVGGNIAIKMQAKGACLSIVTACSSATNAIGEAFRAIRDGYLDCVLAGGAEAAINELGIGGFASIKAISPNLDPNRASIPFDFERSGFVMAEGSGILMMETLDHAKKRRADILGEIIGYASNCDAFHITQPDETASSIIACMKSALKDAKLEPDQVDYINPHGTSSYYNDRLETKGIKAVFQTHSEKVSIGATKSMHGHALGAVGGIEAIITLKALQHDLVPPTINYRVFDPECDLDVTPNVARPRRLRVALKNSLGFGGHNATLIFRKWEEPDA
ncbi:MAG: beta-ketoacyl-ACP synthase II [Candidatus Izemoplasmatales bacterium]|nr:beta-ketoacyl-ACP synthase II [Candidatus Izemoplasmatales bacterium]